MSRSEAVEFVCYHEGGIVNLQRAIDDILEPSLDQILTFKAPVEMTELPRRKSLPAVPVQFQPRLRTVDFFLAPDDRKPSADREADLSEAFEVTTSPLDRIFASSVERAYPFRRALGGSGSPVDSLPSLPQFPETNPSASPSVAPVHTFHDRLLARSRDWDSTRRRKISARISFWNNVVVFLLGELTLYGGVLALIVGLMGLSRGVSFNSLQGMVFSLGVIALGCTALIRSSWNLNWKDLIGLGRV